MDQATSARLKELFSTRLNSAMRLYLETCARCGVCVEACHVYASLPQARYTAVGRAENTGQVFNLTRTELKQTGSGPILVEPVTGQVTLRSSQRTFAVYARGADGSCTSLGECRAVSGRLQLELAPAARTLYDELEAVDAAP